MTASVQLFTRTVIFHCNFPSRANALGNISKANAMNRNNATESALASQEVKLNTHLLHEHEVLGFAVIRNFISDKSYPASDLSASC